MIVSGDFETYYDKEYSLTKMSEVEYILDPRFEVIMLGLKLGSGPTRTYIGYDEINHALARIDWEQTAWLSHNTRFDGAILTWHFSVVPRLYLDTLSMARATTHWSIGKSSLKAVSDCLGLPPKGDAVVRAMGKHLADFSPQELQEYRDYCARDNQNCYDIFQKLRPSFTACELQLIDLVLRMFVLPQVRLDRGVLEEYLAEVRAEKAEALAQVAGIDKGVFSSNQKFAELLAEHGVEVPYKTSPQTGERIPAIARNDWEFKELCVDDTQPPLVQALLSTRLSVKSTIDETRASSLLNLSRYKWAPVPLKYSGARTHRLSGDGGTNWQNFRRGSTLRRAIRAPQGWRIVHRDASQIEARMVAWMAGCKPLLLAFEEQRDVYSEFAGTIYNRVITKEDTLERFVGKTSILGLGYGCGPSRFRHMLYIGNGGISHKIDLDEAGFIVDLYRRQHREIVTLWRECDHLLMQMISSPYTEIELPVQISTDRVWLPNGLCIHYPNLRRCRDEDGGMETLYNDPHGSPRKIYGAKVVENISQALARIIVTDIAVRIYTSTGYHPWLSTHDSLDYCVPESEAEDMNLELEKQFGVTPDWAEGLPLASEGGWGLTLLDAERGVNQ